ncbi:MAG: hypothetical protein Q3976_04800 [Corynebacterium sp.]|nr:hypothetical protein [Corynebacterium sp.]
MEVFSPPRIDCTELFPQLVRANVSPQIQLRTPLSTANATHSAAASLAPPPNNATDPDQPLDIIYSADFHVRLQHCGKFLSITEGESTGKNFQELWDHSAHNVLARCRVPGGIPIQVRSASALCKQATTALQLYTEEVPIVSFCAHPLTFRILATHACHLLGAPACFYSWGSRMLLALPQTAIHDCLPQWIAEHHPLALHFIAHHDRPFEPLLKELNPARLYAPIYSGNFLNMPAIAV